MVPACTPRNAWKIDSRHPKAESVHEIHIRQYADFIFRSSCSKMRISTRRKGEESGRQKYEKQKE
jgi:hypothetical protein